MNNNSFNQMKLFHSIFKGREDVFAIRWEKSGKYSYMPVYNYDMYHYRAYKINGGTFSELSTQNLFTAYR